MVVPFQLTKTHAACGTQGAHPLRLEGGVLFFFLAHGTDLGCEPP